MLNCSIVIIATFKKQCLNTWKSEKKTSKKTCIVSQSYVTCKTYTQQWIIYEEREKKNTNIMVKKEIYVAYSVIWDF